jgi:hypothetical protein
MGISPTEYADLILGAKTTLKNDIIVPNSPGSGVETRYIAPDGRDDEGWLGFLRDNNGVVDIWLMMVSGLRGVAMEQRDSVGTFPKPVSLIVDYYADYRQGTDLVNTEEVFTRNLLAVDLALEQAQGCLGGDSRVKILSWDFRVRLRRFETATCHWGNGVINLEFNELFL